MKNVCDAIEMLRSAQCHLMKSPRFWNDDGDVIATMILSVAASDLQHTGDVRDLRKLMASGGPLKTTHREPVGYAR